MDISRDAVKERLGEIKGTWRFVADGADVDYFTLCRIGRGKAIAPRAETIEKLAKRLMALEASAKKIGLTLSQYCLLESKKKVAQ